MEKGRGTLKEKEGETERGKGNSDGKEGGKRKE